MNSETEGVIAPHDLSAHRALVCFATPCAIERPGGAWRALDFAGADLSLLNTGRAPLLADHGWDLGSLLGVVESAWLEQDRALAVVRFGRHRRARAAWLMVRDCILGNVSMGFSHTVPDTTAAETEAGPGLIRQWRPFELSLVSIPGNWRSHILPDAPAPLLHSVAAAAEARRHSELMAAIHA